MTEPTTNDATPTTPTDTTATTGTATTGTATGGDAAHHSTAGLAHLLEIIPALGPAIIYFTKKDDSAFVRQESAKAVNFGIFILVVSVVLAVLAAFVLPTVFGLLSTLVFVANLVLAILGFLSAKDGKPYNYPFSPLNVVS